MFWFTIGWINKMCYGVSTDAVRWLDYEMVDKNNIKDNVVTIGFLDLSAILTINFTN